MSGVPNEDALRQRFESVQQCSYGHKRSRRGTYRNPPTARDWKWFRLGAEAAPEPVAADAPAEVTKAAPEWPKAWQRSGFNGCAGTAVEALRFLANNPRPSGGESTFNSAHLLQIADELRVTLDKVGAAPVEVQRATSERIAQSLRDWCPSGEITDFEMVSNSLAREFAVAANPEAATADHHGTASTGAAYSPIYPVSSTSRSAVLAVRPAPTAEANPVPLVFLCRAWGETDLPVAELVADWDGVRRFMAREWLGEDDAPNLDGNSTLEQLKADFDEHEEDERGGPFGIEFEIGGVSVERVTGIGSTTRPAAPLSEVEPEAVAQLRHLCDDLVTTYKDGYGLDLHVIADGKRLTFSNMIGASRRLLAALRPTPSNERE